MTPLSTEEIVRAVRQALEEDIGPGDATTLATISEGATSSAVMVAREPLVIAGLSFAEAAFRTLSATLKIERLVQDGQALAAEEWLLRVTGETRAILSAE